MENHQARNLVLLSFEQIYHIHGNLSFKKSAEISIAGKLGAYCVECSPVCRQLLH